jgi:hypothetical protein
MTIPRPTGLSRLPISLGGIEASSRLRREPVRPFALTMLRALDVAYLEAARADKGPEPAAKVSARPFSLALFDTWFPGR